MTKHREFIIKDGHQNIATIITHDLSNSTALIEAVKDHFCVDAARVTKYRFDPDRCNGRISMEIEEDGEINSIGVYFEWTWLYRDKPLLYYITDSEYNQTGSVWASSFEDLCASPQLRDLIRGWLVDEGLELKDFDIDASNVNRLGHIIILTGDPAKDRTLYTDIVEIRN